MKISIVGLGRVGASIAFATVIKGIATQLVLVSRDQKLARGHALDLSHATAFTDGTTMVQAGTVKDTRDSDVVVVTTSIGMTPEIRTRLDLGRANVALFNQLIPQIAAASPEAILLIVTNPVDVMTYHALKLSGFHPSRVFGAGTLVDSARFRTSLSQDIGVHPHDIHAYILGEHGDSQFPALALASTGGELLTDRAAWRQAFEHTLESGYQVMQDKGYTNFAVALGVVMMLESIADDARHTVPVSILLNGFHGLRELCLSLPAVIGRAGIVRALHPLLSEAEQVKLHASARVIKQAMVELGVAAVASPDSIAGAVNPNSDPGLASSL